MSISLDVCCYGDSTQEFAVETLTCDYLQGSTWMTQATRANALNKTTLFTVLTGYDDFIVDDSDKLNQIYETVSDRVPASVRSTEISHFRAFLV